ncbi:DUF6894 family protein [Bradyrhizobium genosp. P]|uniref:DUF6894 family protein n=1 Tax=Bradyrhizobium genosp. P TaxID=83641 RepID=UPI003CFB96B9
MPRYYFHVFHEDIEPDDEGEELPDKHAAVVGSRYNFAAASVADGLLQRNRTQSGHGLAKSLEDYLPAVRRRTPDAVRPSSPSRLSA